MIQMITPPTQGFYTLNDILSPEECQKIIDDLPEEGTGSWAGSLYETDDLPGYSEFIARRYRCDANMRKYVAERTGVVSPKMYVCKYIVGEGAKTHRDGNKFTINILLNNDFKGGQFLIKNRYPIDLNVGDAVVFDTETFHGVRPVTSGVRYALNIGL